ncbi:MAG: VIT1/CCC1 transporter family protein [Clostridia bacterium]|nr:VIT1/CCC1 transporter family protein [Clostridia bacterium]
MSYKIDENTRKKLLKDQQDEINAHHMYLKIAELIKDEHNKNIVKEVAKDELSHYERIKVVTGEEVKPQKIKIFMRVLITKMMGLTFSIKLFEKGEGKGIESYGEINEKLDFVDEIIEDEERHEQELIGMINEERLNYIGSVVLGLNDALVELTGALAGYTFAFQNTKLIALTGLITGISASFSMAASEYLSTRQEGGDDAFKSSIYTGVAYILTVIFLVLPYLIIPNPFVSLACTLSVAVLIIFLFNYYISVAKDLNFKRRFIEMAVISLGVAGISFLIGVLVKTVIGIDV